MLDLDPDVIIIYKGGNDVHARLVEPASYRGDDSGHKKQWDLPRIFLLKHSALFRVLLRKSCITRLIGIGEFVTPQTSYEPKEAAKHNLL